MSIIGAYIVPHPPVVIPEVGMGKEKEIQKTIDAYEEIARRIGSQDPETVVVITPHAIMYSDYIHISPGSKGRGSLSRFGAPQVIIDAPYDTEMISGLSEAAAEEGIAAGTLGEKDRELDHGVIVPLYFIGKQLSHFNLVRISTSGLTLEEHYRFGMCLRKTAEKLGRRTVIVASGDLSHRLSNDGPYTYAKEGPDFDRHLTSAMQSADFMKFITLDEGFCSSAGECGLRSFVIMAGALDRLSVDADMLSYEGPFGVGYAICAYKPIAADNERNFLDRLQKVRADKLADIKGKEDPFVKLARSSLEYYVKNGKTLPLPENLPEELIAQRAGVFVSLKKHGRLRGCIGTIAPTEDSIAQEIIKNAVSAGVGDVRFPVVTGDELKDIVYSVDVLSKPEPIRDRSELDALKYGVIVNNGHKKGLLLPNLENVHTVEEQLEIALHKAGISSGSNYSIERFEVVRHH
jgi:AmmeMemoRadiSam system protein A/AmmeMemoRadiSam system protein B